MARAARRAMKSHHFYPPRIYTDLNTGVSFHQNSD
jgi:hypothetical protein